MRKLLTGLRKNLWVVLLVAVGLMSGITAIFREWLATFYPAAVEPRRVFQACLWTCFFFSAIALVIRQQFVIVGLESRLDTADAQQRNNKRLHELFGSFMAEGESLASDFRQGMQIYGPWLQKRNDWMQRASKAIEDAGWPVDAADFRHAGEKQLKVGPGVTTNDVAFIELYREQLSGYRNKLAEIVARRLP